MNNYFSVKILDIANVNINTINGGQKYLIEYRPLFESSEIGLRLIENTSEENLGLGKGIRSNLNITYKEEANKVIIKDMYGQEYVLVSSGEEGRYICKEKGWVLNNKRLIINDIEYQFSDNNILENIRSFSGEMTITYDEEGYIKKVDYKEKASTNIKESIEIDRVDTVMNFTLKKYNKIIEQAKVYLYQDKKLYEVVTYYGDEGETPTSNYAIYREENEIKFTEFRYNLSEYIYFTNGKITKVKDKYENELEVTYALNKTNVVKGENEITYYYNDQGCITYCLYNKNKLNIINYDSEKRVKSTSEFDLKNEETYPRRYEESIYRSVISGQYTNNEEDNILQKRQEVVSLTINNEEFVYSERANIKGKAYDVKSYLFCIKAKNNNLCNGVKVKIEYLSETLQVVDESEVYVLRSAQEDMIYMFSSYSRKDYERVRVVYTYLENGGSITLSRNYYLQGQGNTYIYDSEGKMIQSLNDERIVNYAYTKEGKLFYDGTAFIEEGVQVDEEQKDEYVRSVVSYDGTIELISLKDNKIVRTIDPNDETKGKDEYVYEKKEGTDLISKVTYNDQVIIQREYDEYNRLISNIAKNSGKSIIKNYLYHDDKSPLVGKIKTEKITGTDNLNRIDGHVSMRNHVEKTDMKEIDYIDSEEIRLKTILNEYGDLKEQKYNEKTVVDVEYDPADKEKVVRYNDTYFTYEDNKLTKVSKDEKENYVVEYVYDDSDRITTIKDKVNLIDREYEYDKGELQSLANNNGEYKQEFIYENRLLKGNTISQNGESVYSLNTVNKLKHHSKVLEIYSKLSSSEKSFYVTSLYTRGTNYGSDPFANKTLFLDNYHENISLYNEVVEFTTLDKDGIRCVDLSQKEICYKFIESDLGNEIVEATNIVKGSGGMFVKISNLTVNYTLMEINLNNKYISLSLRDSTLHLFHYFGNYKAEVETYENVNIIDNKWHLINVAYDIVNNNLEVLVDNKKVFGVNNLFNTSHEKNLINYIKYGDSTRENCEVYYALPYFSIKEHLSEKEMDEMIKLFNLSIDNDMDNQNQITTYTYYESNVKGDLVVFNNNVVSKKGKKPNNLLRRDLYDEKKNYEYDSEKKQFIYAGKEVLEYTLTSQVEGTLSLDMKLEEIEQRKTLLKVYDDIETVMELSIENNKVILLLEDGELEKSQTLEDLSGWHNYSISWIKNVQSESMSTFGYTIKLYVDGEMMFTTSSYQLEHEFEGELLLEIQEGVKIEKLRMLETSLTHEDILLDCINKDMFWIERKYDKEYKELEKIIYNNCYEIYKKENTYLDNKLTKEIISMEGDTFTNEYNYYDNNVKNVKTLNNDVKAFQYDALNRLIKESGGNYSYQYIYDSRGNLRYRINKSGQEDKNLVYDEENRLIKYNDMEIIYSDTERKYDSFLYPVKFKKDGGDIEFTWDKQRLVNMEIDNKQLVFKYDDRGLRIAKRFVDSENNIVQNTLFNYDEYGRLVSEVRANDVIIYNYENNELIGFTLNGTPYFYLKDITGNIYAIVDVYSVIVGSYDYDAWGNLISIDVDIDNIASFNKIRYKGYYYDVETGYFWLSLRYYSPELGRFIQPAEVSSLNPSSINGLNLYSYANNNPIGIAYRSSGASGGMVSSIASSVGGLNSGYRGTISNSSKWHFDPNFLTEAFGHIENGFSIIEGALAGYRNVKHLPQLESLSKISKKLMIGGIVLGLVVDAHNNFSNEQLSLKEQTIGFTVDGLYTIGSAALSYGISSLVTAGLALIPGVGLFAVLGGTLVSIGVMELIDWAVEEYGWLDSIKDWIESW